MSHTHFRVNLHSIVAWMSRDSLLTLTSDIVPVLSEVFLDIQATMECRITDQNSKPLNIEDEIKVSHQTI